MLQSACAKLDLLYCLVPQAAALPGLPGNEYVFPTAFELLGHLQCCISCEVAGALATLPLLRGCFLKLVGVVLLRWDGTLIKSNGLGPQLEANFAQSRKRKSKRNDYTFRRQLNDKPSI